MKRWCGGGRVGGEKDNRWGGTFPRQPLIAFRSVWIHRCQGGEGGRRGPQVDAVIDAAARAAVLVRCCVLVERCAGQSPSQTAGKLLKKSTALFSASISLISSAYMCVCVKTPSPGLTCCCMLLCWLLHCVLAMNDLHATDSLFAH
mgnify:CR=1 FL=1